MIFAYFMTFLATVFLDIMDTINFHRGIMIFPKTKYWSITSSGRKWIGKDGWHDSKKIMQFCFSLGMWFAYSSGLFAPEFLIYHILITMVIYYMTHRMFFGYYFIKKEFRTQRADLIYRPDNKLPQ